METPPISSEQIEQKLQLAIGSHTELVHQKLTLEQEQVRLYDQMSEIDQRLGLLVGRIQALRELVEMGIVEDSQLNGEFGATS